MPKTTHKITPEVYKVIKQLLPKLPKVQIVKDGKPLYRAGKVEKVVYRTLNKSLKKELLKQDDTLIGSEIINKQEKEPLYVNHEVELINAYKNDGNAGIKAYIDKVFNPEAFKSSAYVDSEIGISMGARFFEKYLPTITKAQKRIKLVNKYPILRYFYKAKNWFSAKRVL